jgi:histone deacetylase complex regulatory component SIN3
MPPDRTATGPKTEQARRLINARLRAGFERAKDATSRFGWTYETYIQHERGARQLRWSVAKKYADAFGVAHDWLLLEADAPLSGSQPTAVAARPAAKTPPAGSDTWAKDIQRILQTDRSLLQEVARKAIEFALVAVSHPDGLPPEQIQRLAVFAAQSVLAGRAERQLEDQAAGRLHARSEAGTD